jgi:phosphinothricin acetyltransferase
LKPVTIEKRATWFEHHSDGARYRRFVADEGGSVLGWAGTGRFRDRAAYDTSVEATIYCAPEATGRGIGSIMYRALFEAIRNEDINRILAGITTPNEASVKIHKRFGFRPIGTFSEVGASSESIGTYSGWSARLESDAQHLNSDPGLAS